MLKIKPTMPKYIYLTLEWTFLAIFLTAKKLKEPKTQPKMLMIMCVVYWFAYLTNSEFAIVVNIFYFDSL